MSHTIYIGQVFLLDLHWGRLKVWHAKAWDWTGCNLSAVGELAVKNYFQQTLLSCSPLLLATVQKRVNRCLCWQVASLLQVDSQEETPPAIKITSLCPPSSSLSPQKSCWLNVTISHWSQTVFIWLHAPAPYGERTATKLGFGDHTALDLPSQHKLRATKVLSTAGCVLMHHACVQL